MMAVDEYDGSLTPPQPSKTIKKKQHSSAKMSKNHKANKVTGYKKTYSYMSPISSDDDFPEMPWRAEHDKRPQRQSRKSNLVVFSDKCTKTETREMKRQKKEKTESVKRAICDFDSRAKDGSVSEDAVRVAQKENKTKKRRKKVKSIKFLDSASSDSENDVDVKLALMRKNKALAAKRPATVSSHKQRIDGVEWVSRKTVPIECEVCGLRIGYKAKLKRHMLSHTGEKPFKCNECGKQYTSSSNLRIHQRSHSGTMDYACDECGQKFTHLPYLKRHLLRHSGQKMHTCKHCGKGFFQKYHLLRHIMVHTRQADHVCEECGMSFSHTDSLNIHRRNVHSFDINALKANAEKLFHCETCNKYFANYNSLKTHKRIHTGDTPYSCNVCSRQFKQSSHLYSHIITHSNKKPHACNLCELTFTRKSYLRKHKERVHSGGEDAKSL